MATLVMPFDNSNGIYSAKVWLQGVTYGFNLQYNVRCDRWMLDITDSNGIVLLSGLPILEEQDLTARFVNRIAGLPPGRMVAIDPSGAALDPNGATFGAGFPLLYIEAH